MKLYNSLSRQLEPFSPRGDTVGLYACGPTVYGPAHLGNLRAAVVFDQLVRTLSFTWPVTFVRNLTDVDDKIIDAARARGGNLMDSMTAITTAATEKWWADTARLGARKPTIEPKASTHIPEMITLVETLLDRGVAYVSGDHVFFHVAAMPDALRGVLSGRGLPDPETALAHSRTGGQPEKRHPADFVLWKPSDDTQPGWDSPWGFGRPGWHLECSAMSRKHLGDDFDIHAGGQDLIFPHHENEIAQSSCSCHGPARIQAKTWVHVGMLRVNGEKMSKSLGNFITLDKLAHLPGAAIRLMLLRSHYRATLDWTDTMVADTLAMWHRLETAAKSLTKTGVVPAAIKAALEEDLNTPQAITALLEMLDQNDPALLDGMDALGLLDADMDHAMDPKTVAGIQTLVDARTSARKAKDFAESDALRTTLTAKGVLLLDSPNGTTWRFGPTFTQ